jgi:hypothetical protein
LARQSAVGAYRATGNIGYRFFVAVLTMALVHGFLDSNFVRVGFASMIALLCITMLVLHSERTAEI